MMNAKIAKIEKRKKCNIPKIFFGALKTEQS